MSGLEWIATALGIACVALAAMRSIWTFPAGIASVTLVGVVVFDARLYSDAALQAFFVAANVYGWREWVRARGRSIAMPVGVMTRHARLRWAAGWAVATLVWGGAMRTLTDAAWPWWDAAIAAASVVAQVLMARRRIEHWLVWIAVDLASVPMYLARGLHILTGLYVIYLALALWGLAAWRRAGTAA